MGSARDLVVVAEGVGKRYRLGMTDRAHVKDEFKALFARLRGKPDPRVMVDEGTGKQRAGDYFWSLRDVSFQLERGEVLGIIGRNGAGKSTMLKLLSRITMPTEGSIRMRGKVASLLEVGTGFHPELTGRENVYLNGAILGMRKAEINKRINDIIAFSGIEHHIDTPIKRYSSGMKVRLGFSVAAHLDPDILIVDEVLAVGDAEFQRKCIDIMRSVAESGRTILFVSHNMSSVQTLCSRIIWLEKGRVIMDGPTEEVARAYLSKTAVVPNHEVAWEEHEAPGKDGFKLLGVRAVSEHANRGFWRSSPIRIEVEVLNPGVTDEDVNLRMLVRTSGDLVAFVTDMGSAIGKRAWPIGRSKVSCTIPADLLNVGSFSIGLTFGRQGAVWFSIPRTVSFEIGEMTEEVTPKRQWPGVFRPVTEWKRS